MKKRNRSIPRGRLPSCGPLVAGIVLLAVLPWSRSARAYERYNGAGGTGCSMCHGNFAANPYRSPTGEVWPDTAMNVHRNSGYMNTDCDACHTSGDSRNPYIGRSAGDTWGGTPGEGCVGCHGREYGGASEGYGLRRHHAARGGAICATCHAADATPLPETASPANYGGPLTLAHDPCNAAPGYGEDYSGNLRGLDNDGDTLYDAADPDCGGCIDGDADTYSPSGGTCGAIDCNDGAASVHPGAPEACNAADDDCDATTDEGLTRACATACGPGTESCSTGSWLGCTAPAPATETCNARDDDCDGTTDELLSRTCSTACGSGTETCSAG